MPGGGLLLTMIVAGCATTRMPRGYEPIEIATPEPPAIRTNDVLDVGDRPLQSFAFAPPLATDTISVGPRLPVRHTVARGETLFGIAREHLGHGARWQELLHANPSLRPDALAAGDVVLIP